jgi:recombination endonuclease VII
MDDDEKRARANERSRRWYKKRWDNDLDFRAKKLATNKAWHDANKDEVNARRRAKYAADPEYRANQQMGVLTSKYGITRDDFAAMLEQQHNACGICERPFTRKPCVDHCHVTGLVRGLLCGGCNSGIGHLQDNPVFAHKAGAYLERWFEHLFQLFNTKDNEMTSNEDATEDAKAARLMRKAILHELQQPFGVDRPPPTDRLQAVVRALVAKAEAQDIQAIKEVLDRVDGKTPSGLNSIESRKQVNVTWKFPSSKLNPSKQGARKPQPTTVPVSTRRAGGSPRSKNATNGSTAP